MAFASFDLPSELDGPPVSLAGASDAETATAALHMLYESGDPRADAEQDGGALLVNPGYVVRMHHKWRTPAWTLHRLTPEQIAPRSSTLDTPGRFETDRRVPDNLRSSHGDYSNSGFDRGHMVPSADFQQDGTLKDATYVTTNITPMTPELNQGVWADIECFVRRLVRSESSPAYVVTGAVHSSNRSRGISRRKLGTAQAFYKIIVLPSASDAPPRLWALLVPHQHGYGDAPLTRFVTTVDAIEAVTGEDFLERIPDANELPLESTLDPDPDWLRGSCSEPKADS